MIFLQATPTLHADGDSSNVLMALSPYTTCRKDDGPPGVEGVMELRHAQDLPGMRKGNRGDDVTSPAEATL